MVRWSSCWSRISPASQIEQNVGSLATSTRTWMYLTMCICLVNLWCLLLGYFMLCARDSKGEIFLMSVLGCVFVQYCACVCVEGGGICCRLRGWSNCWAGVWGWGQMTSGCLGWAQVSKESSQAAERHGWNYSGSSVIIRDHFFMSISFAWRCYVSPCGWYDTVEAWSTLANLCFHTL